MQDLSKNRVPQNPIYPMICPPLKLQVWDVVVYPNSEQTFTNPKVIKKQVVPAQVGAEIALGLYYIFFIYI